MIAISNESGGLLKSIPFEEGKVVGFNRLYGFISEEGMHERQRNRKRHGFRIHDEQFDFKFRIVGSEDNFKLDAPENCKVELRGGNWMLSTPHQSFTVGAFQPTIAIPAQEKERDKDKTIWFALLLTLVIPLGILLLPKNAKIDEPKIIEQVTVQIKPEVQKPVEVTTALDAMPEVKKQAQTAKRAINQNLGFLGLLGRKDLKKAVGGVPTDLKDVSPGAGPGGKEGSGGELLVGLGQGLKRTTVGNTGVAGLGGVGTRGAGGGAGGYGNSEIGSGEGKALSSMPVSQELVLEGGLDRSVVQATIAKYLSQVRACYENGLKRNPGLGGQVTMAFEIGAGGNLNFANVQKTSLDDPEVESCISTRMMSWQFPKPRGGVAVKVSYPFVLRSTKG